MKELKLNRVKFIMETNTCTFDKVIIYSVFKVLQLVA